TIVYTMVQQDVNGIASRGANSDGGIAADMLDDPVVDAVAGDVAERDDLSSVLLAACADALREEPIHDTEFRQADGRGMPRVHARKDGAALVARRIALRVQYDRGEQKGSGKEAPECCDQLHQ